MSLRMAFCAALLAIPGALLAQPPGHPGDQRPFERIEQLRKVRLIEMLEMNEDQSIRFFARMNEHELARRDLVKEKGDALDRLERLVRNKAEDKEFDQAFADVLSIDDRLIAEQRKFFAGLTDILTAQQRGKYLLFERRFEKELREAMREAQRRRRQPEPD
jgi:hypothetical protein